MNEYNLESLEKFTSQVRRDIVRMVHAQNSGHPGGSLGCVEYFTAIYKVIMNHSNNFSMDGKNEDLFFLSNGHISPVFYSVLARTGYFPVNELNTFRKIDSRLQGHPTTHEGLPGIRVASGSLGQGLSVAIGAATTKKLNNDNSLVYTLHGDGELQEGQIWEAAMYASAKKIDNLISTIDFNGRQIDGDVDDILSLGNLEKKWNAFGWKTLSCNGNNLQEMIATLETAKSLTGKKQPVMIIMKTEMGYGIDYMMGSHKWHGVAPNDEQLEIALNQQVESLGDY
ncbi:transketolase [bacterium]|nr:transketolase [bacterium]